MTNGIRGRRACARESLAAAGVPSLAPFPRRRTRRPERSRRARAPAIATRRRRRGRGVPARRPALRPPASARRDSRLSELSVHSAGASLAGARVPAAAARDRRRRASSSRGAGRHALAGARAAAALGRSPVAPSPAGSPSRAARGTEFALLRDGARLATGVGDVLAMIGDADGSAPRRECAGRPAWRVWTHCYATCSTGRAGEDQPPAGCSALTADADELLRRFGGARAEGLLERRRAAPARYFAPTSAAAAARYRTGRSDEP